MIAEKNRAIIEAAKTFLEMFALQCSQCADRAGSFNMNPIKDSIHSHSARTMVAWHDSLRVRFFI